MPILVDSGGYWSFLADLWADIYAIAVGNPLDHIGWQGALAFGHAHLP